MIGYYADWAWKGDVYKRQELWEMAGYGGQVCLQPWPEYDESKTVAATAKMAVQVLSLIHI